MDVSMPDAHEGVDIDESMLHGLVTLQLRVLCR
jgi:hypothetical protein